MSLDPSLSLNPFEFKKVTMFTSAEDSDFYLNAFQAMVPWQKFALAPNSRLVYRWGESPLPELDGVIERLISKLSALENLTVRGIFLNLYKNGQDHCPFHRDQYGTDVYTLSLGSTRDFLLKPDDVTQKTQTIKLYSGDLYYMAKEIHSKYRHSIPKRAGVSEPRISIVFFTNKF